MSLQATALSFSYSTDQELLQSLNLALPPRARIALTGPNGSGKTTLLRLLAGSLAPDGGQVRGAGESVLLVGQQVHQLDEPASGGEARIAALREAFVCAPATLLLDEPTNDLDADAREWLRSELESATSSILIVSHDPMILDLVDEIWELRAGRLQKHPPGYAEYLARIAAEEERLHHEIDSLRSEARQAEAKSRQVVESQQKRMSRGEKQAEKSNEPKIFRGMKKRQAEKTLARVSGVQEERAGEVRERLEQARLRLRSLSMFEWDGSVSRPPAGKRLIRIRSARLPGAKHPFDLDVIGPRRILLRGPNGSGKSTLLRALAGDLAAMERAPGEYFLGAPFQLFDQSLSQFDSREELWRWFHERTRLEVALARSVLGRLGFEQEEQLRPVNGLSGGERVRLEIALALHRSDPPQILLLDEPTNHLDLESRRILLQFIERFEGALILVSHDAAFTSALRLDEVVDLPA